MWPFDRLRQIRYDRRYKAAVVVLLGTYAFDQLPASQRERVETEVQANFNRSDSPAAAWRRALEPSAAISVFRAAAMEKMGIAPAIAHLSWLDLFEPWSFWRIRNLWPMLRGF